MVIAIHTRNTNCTPWTMVKPRRPKVPTSDRLFPRVTTSCQIPFTDGLSVLVGSSPLLKSTYSKLTSLSVSYVDCNSMLFLKLASEMNITISIPIFVELTLSWNQQSPHLSWSMNHHSPNLLLVTTPFLLASTVSTGFYLNIWWIWCRLNLLFRWVDSLLFLWNHQL